MKEVAGSENIAPGHFAAISHDDAYNIERKRFGANGHDAIFADDAILLAAAHEFAGQQQQRTLAAVDEHELVHRRAAVILRRCSGPNYAAVPHHSGSAALAYDHLAARESFLERQEAAGVLRGATDVRKNSNVLVSDGIEDAPVAFRTLRSLGRTRSSPHKGEPSKGADSRQARNVG